MLKPLEQPPPISTPQSLYVLCWDLASWRSPSFGHLSASGSSSPLPDSRTESNPSTGSLLAQKIADCPVFIVTHPTRLTDPSTLVAMSTWPVVTLSITTSRPAQRTSPQLEVTLTWPVDRAPNLSADLALDLTVDPALDRKCKRLSLVALLSADRHMTNMARLFTTKEHTMVTVRLLEDTEKFEDLACLIRTQ